MILNNSQDKAPNSVTLAAMQAVAEPDVYASADALFAKVSDADNPEIADKQTFASQC